MTDYVRRTPDGHFQVRNSMTEGWNDEGYGFDREEFTRFILEGGQKLLDTPPTVELPKHWPPRVGEVWLHGPSDLVYAVRQNNCYDDETVLTRNNVTEDEIYVSDFHYVDAQAVPSEWERLLPAADAG